MNPLVEKIRKARETSLAVEGHTFTVRRPTDAEATTLASGSPFDILKRFVVGWDLTELDLIPGGDPTPVPFDADVWAEWVSDHPELWAKLTETIIGSYQAYVKAREAASKN